MKTVALIFTSETFLWILWMYMYAWHFQNEQILYYHITVTYYMTEMFLFVCLFVCLFVTGDTRRASTNTRHSWPLSSEGSVRHRISVYMVISEDPWPWNSHFLPSVWQWSFNDLVVSRPGIEHRSPACIVNALPTESSRTYMCMLW